MFTTAEQMNARPKQSARAAVWVWGGCALIWAINFAFTLRIYLRHTSEYVTKLDVMTKGLCAFRWAGLALYNYLKLKKQKA